jgi:hypothetical protein
MCLVELITFRLACETHYIMGLHLQPHSVSSTKWISHWRFVNLNLMCVEFSSLLSIPFQRNPCFYPRLSPTWHSKRRGLEVWNFDFICVQLSLSTSRLPSVIWLYFGTQLTCIYRWGSVQGCTNLNVLGSEMELYLARNWLRRLTMAWLWQRPENRVMQFRTKSPN